jgi:hypothetical protein
LTVVKLRSSTKAGKQGSKNFTPLHYLLVSMKVFKKIFIMIFLMSIPYCNFENTNVKDTYDKVFDVDSENVLTAGVIDNDDNLYVIGSSIRRINKHYI